MLYSISDVAVTLGLSVPQTRRRVDAVITDLDGDLRRGSRGKILLTEKGLSLLRRAVELEKERGLSCKDAMRVVKEETAKPDENRGKSGDKVSGEVITEASLIRELRARIEDKDREIARLEREIEFLRERVKELTPRPLPRPRRSLFGWLRGIHKQKQSN